MGDERFEFRMSSTHQKIPTKQTQTKFIAKYNNTTKTTASIKIHHLIYFFAKSSLNIYKTLYYILYNLSYKLNHTIIITCHILLNKYINIHSPSATFFSKKKKIKEKKNLRPHFSSVVQHLKSNFLFSHTVDLPSSTKT
ncbi:hypothetical protein ACJW31_07G158800 [Castanea mollissima]